MISICSKLLANFFNPVHSVISKPTTFFATKKYILSQFPYPSGDLHLGHARVYLIGDTLSLYYKMKGQEVIYPIGWDAFGLPAQNAAILHKKNPKIWTNMNIQNMTRQLKKLKIGFSWDREISTCQPQYYKYTQQIFIKMFKKGLAYRANSVVNWDPVDKTVLANEQVDNQGKSWRSGALVQKKVLEQWFFRIRSKTGELVEGLSQLPLWLDKVKQMQRGWINVKKGFFVQCRIIAHVEKNMVGRQIEIFTTNLSYLGGNNSIIYLNEPGEAKQLGKIHLTQIKKQFLLKRMHQPDKQEGIYYLHYEDTQSNLQNLKVSARVGQTTRLKDWLISRQRYWGTPIPIINCQNCGFVPVPEQQLPVKLPQWPQGTNVNPLLSDQFLKCKCPQCQGQALRQSDTMDTFVDSSWYFLRFLDPKNTTILADLSLTKPMMPVQIYIGGMEHAIMHLLYARFINRILYDQNLSPVQEPFKQLVVQGLIKGKTYKLMPSERYLRKDQLSKYQSEKIIETYEKMSKSKFNGTSPDQILQTYNVDQLRIALLFAGPPQNDIDFHEQMLISARRFIARVDQLANKLLQKLPNTSKIKKQIVLSENVSHELKKQIQTVLQKLDVSIQKRYLHTYIAGVMELTNTVRNEIITKSEELQQSLQIQLDIFLLLLAVIKPIAPQTSKQLLFKISKISEQQSIINYWPTIHFNTIQILIKQGKKLLRKDQIPPNLSNDQIIEYLQLDSSKVLDIKRLKSNMMVILK